MRLHGAAFALLLLFTGFDPAAAQAPSGSPERQARAADLAKHFMIDTGLMRRAVAIGVEREAPVMRERILSDPQFARITPPHRAALSAAIDGFGPMIDAEVDAGLNDWIAAHASDAVSSLSDAELSGLDDFFSTATGQSVLTKIVGGVVTQAAASPDGSAAGTVDASILSPDERAAMETFLHTPSGRAFVNHMNDIMSGFSVGITASMARAQQGVLPRFLQSVCAALEDECPARLRQ